MHRNLMNLMDLVSLECILAPLKASEKRSAVSELVDALASAGKVIDAEALRQAVWTREQTRTTGIGHGLAIPHGKSAGVTDLAMAIGKPAEPMDFDSIDGQPVRLIVLLASPPERTGDHIQALARISRLMTMEDFREQIYAAETPEAIYELLKSQEGLGR